MSQHNENNKRPFDTVEAAKKRMYFSLNSDIDIKEESDNESVVAGLDRVKAGEREEETAEDPHSLDIDIKVEIDNANVLEDVLDVTLDQLTAAAEESEDEDYLSGALDIKVEIDNPSVVGVLEDGILDRVTASEEEDRCLDGAIDTKVKINDASKVQKTTTPSYSLVSERRQKKKNDASNRDTATEHEEEEEDYDDEEIESESESDVSGPLSEDGYFPPPSMGSYDSVRWKKQISYTIASFQPTDTPGVRNIPANICKDSEPVNFLSLFLTLDVWVQLVQMTNLHAARVKNSKPSDYYAANWHDVTVEEMKAFVGVRLSMEYTVVKRRLELYFRRTGFLFDTPGFRLIFTRDRFLGIWKFLHYVDEENPLIDKSDKLYNVRPFLDYLTDKFQKYYVPKQQMSLKEGMIPVKNRTAIKQYIQNRPLEWGINSFVLCESSTGYVYNIEVYTGKREDRFIRQLGATGSLVVGLASCIAGQNYQLFMDSVYSSPELSRCLLGMNIETCGAVQPNQKDFPQQLIRQKKNMKNGEYDYLSCDGVTAVMWCDRVPLYFITTFHDLNVMNFVNHKKEDRSNVRVPCPQVVTDYIKAMGGCDRNDQLIKLYRSRKHYRWPRGLIMKCILWSCYNAYVIRGHFKHSKQQGKRTNTFYDFVDELCISLIGNVRSQAVQRRRSVPTSAETRLLNVGDHHPERPDEATGNNRCAVCREKAKQFETSNPGVGAKNNPFKKSRTAFRCSACLTYLCIRQGSSCWKEYHTKTEYWT